MAQKGKSQTSLANRLSLEHAVGFSSNTYKNRGNRRLGTHRSKTVGSVIRPLIASILSLCLMVGTVKAETGWLPPPDGEIQRIAFGSCAKHWQPQPIWKSVIAADPDLFLFLGDAIYADTDGRTAWPVMPGQLAGEWNRLADKPEIQELMATVPIMATWDNHD